jgi:VanZ family protein
MFLLPSSVVRYVMASSPTPTLWPARKYRWLIWGLYLAAWSTALLIPLPAVPEWKVHDISLRFLFAKAVHVSAYAVLAVLTGWLLVPSRYRWLPALALAVHATSTELLQRLVEGRTGTLDDVGLDLIGIALGCLVSWKWWCAPS